MPKPIDWDGFRERYDAMCYDEHLSFYDDIYEQHPNQQHYHLDLVQAFFQWAQPQDVFEVGGWRGELAAQILPRFPGIRTWINHEICRAAVRDTVCTDHRYRAIVPHSFLWQCPELCSTKADTLVMSHVAEHMKHHELAALVAQLATVRYAYIEAPIPDVVGVRLNWKGDTSTHVLEVGWPDVVSTMSASGFRLVQHIKWDWVRCFSKD